MDCSLPLSMDSPGKKTGMCSHSSLQGIFLTPGIKPGSQALQADSLWSKPPGKPMCAHDALFNEAMNEVIQSL